MCTHLHSDLTFRILPQVQVVLYHTVIARKQKQKNSTCVGSRITMLLSSTPHLPWFKIGYTPACQVCAGRQLCIWTRLEHTKSERGTHLTGRHFWGTGMPELHIRCKIALMHFTKTKHKGPRRVRPKYLEKSWENHQETGKKLNIMMLPQDSHTLPTALGSNKLVWVIVWGLRPREANPTRMQTPYVFYLVSLPQRTLVKFKNYSGRNTELLIKTILTKTVNSLCEFFPLFDYLLSSHAPVFILQVC